MAPAAFTLLPTGAIIQSFIVGKTNIVQGFPSESQYPTYNSPFFGETIGRVANRIDKGTIQSLNGKSYQLATNDGPNALHGGPKGWSKKVWDGPELVGTKTIEGLEGKLEGGESVKFSLKSEDGDEGYPGTVLATVTYTTGTQKTAEGTEVRVLAMEYEARLVGDEVEETIINLTNHSYFNLNAGPTIAGTEVTLTTNSYLILDDGGIPTSVQPAPFAGITANKPFTLGETEPNVDDCFIVNPSEPSVPLDTRKSPLNKLVSAYHPDTKIHLEVLSTEPAFQFYTGKFIDVPEIKGPDGNVEVPARGKRSGFCVEPSRYINAVNVPEWRDQVVLKKGQVYGARIVYRGWDDE